MDCQSSCLDFAAIGHQDSWTSISDFMNGIRPLYHERLSVDKIKDVFSYIPPRDMFRISVKSTTGAEINGVYIETFIDPDKLDIKFVKANMAKVLDGIRYASKLEPKIVTLGGFTSIVLEGNIENATTDKIKFTTGNTLTAAFVVKGIEKAAIHRGINLSKSKVLIIGATGDIGLACGNYFKNKVKELLLCARNKHRLEKLSVKLANEGVRIQHEVDVNKLSHEADVIICVASSNVPLSKCKENVLICDAGYPKNLNLGSEYPESAIFHGGMGKVHNGFSFFPDYSNSIYRYPSKNVAHACLLEGIVLAFEGKTENYSMGKGNITTERMEEIYGMSERHGISLAPFFNSRGLW